MGRAVVLRAVLGCAVLLVGFIPRCAVAEVVVVANHTQRLVSFVAAIGAGPTRAYKVDAGDLVPLACQPGEQVRLGFESDGQRRAYALAANTLYCFRHAAESEILDLEEIALFNRPADNGEPAAARKPNERSDTAKPGEKSSPVFTKVKVKLLVDDDEKAVRAIWEDRLRLRVANASKILEKYAGISLEVVECDTWVTDNAVQDFGQTLLKFEANVRPDPADIAIGFSSQFSLTKGQVHLGGTRGPFASHILLREWSRQISEPERLEVLVHELGHRFGAVHSPEPHSVMRPMLGDRKSRARSFRIVFDPLNTMAMTLLGQEMRDHGVRRIHDISPTTRNTLIGIYSTLTKALPDDPAAAQYLVRLGEPPPATTRAARRGAPTQIQSARDVRDAVVEAGDQNRRLPTVASEPGQPVRQKGDALMSLYVRAAAQAALAVPEAHQAKAFALGMAVATGDTDQLNASVLVRELLPSLETADDRQRRLAVIGTPTMADRNDLARHFFLSAAIASMATPSISESAGLLKELQDAQGKSGFSFVDLAADLAGIELARQLLSSPARLRTLAESFEPSKFLPASHGLAEGLTLGDFEHAYGSTADPRLKAEIERIRLLVAQLPAFRNLAHAPVAAESNQRAKP